MEFSPISPNMDTHTFPYWMESPANRIHRWKVLFYSVMLLIRNSVASKSMKRYNPGPTSPCRNGTTHLPTRQSTSLRPIHSSRQFWLGLFKSLLYWQNIGFDNEFGILNRNGDCFNGLLSVVSGPYDVWVFLTYVYDDASQTAATFYVNAEFGASYSFGCSNDTLVMASVGCFDVNYYSGYYQQNDIWPYNMTKVMYFNTSLTQQEVVELYQVTKPRIPQYDNLQYYWVCQNGILKDLFPTIIIHTHRSSPVYRANRIL